MVIKEHDEQDSEIRLIVADVEVDCVDMAIAPDISEDVLDHKVRRIRAGAVRGIKAEFVAHVGDELLNESVETLFRFRRKRKAIQSSPFGVRKVELKGQREAVR